jgi:amidophosphoribosyltransferase
MHHFTAEEISAKIAEIVKPNHIFSDVQVIYQTIENLHIACPDNLGDWYFTGDYPTPGGNRVALNAFINYMEGKNVRAYLIDFRSRIKIYLSILF